MSADDVLAGLGGTAGAWMDKPLPEDEAIAAAHPLQTGRDDLYMEAMRLVGARHSKAGLVNLVCWLLAKNDALRSQASRDE